MEASLEEASDFSSFERLQIQVNENILMDQT